jgi:hypothetical protein
MPMWHHSPLWRAGQVKTALQAAGDYFETETPRGSTVQEQLADIIEARDAEWRRLVEEAQADANSWAERSMAIQKQEEAVETERDRLKGELAEARRLLVVEIPTEHEMRCKTMHGTRDCWRCDVDAFLAATPAEQAHPTWTPGEVAAAKLMAEGYKDVFPDDPHNESLRAAEQAQGEAACANCGRPGPGCMESAQVAALAKRVDELTAHLDRITSPPPRPFVSEIKRHWDDPAVRDNFVDATLDDHEYRMRDLEWRFKTSPDVAAPGHAFVPCTDDGVKWRCFMCGMVETDPIHAVPPIPEGAKP